MDKKIAIIEDEEVLQKVLDIQMVSSGYQVICAEDGESAIELIKSEKPDLVLLDLLIPKVHGLDVLRTIKKDASTKKIPVIIFSNSSNEEEIEEGKKLGAIDYFVKASADLDELKEQIDSILRDS